MQKTDNQKYINGGGGGGVKLKKKRMGFFFTKNFGVKNKWVKKN